MSLQVYRIINDVLNIVFLLIFYSMKIISASGKQSTPANTFLSISTVLSIDK